MQNVGDEVTPEITQSLAELLLAGFQVGLQLIKIVRQAVAERFDVRIELLIASARFC